MVVQVEEQRESASLVATPRCVRDSAVERFVTAARCDDRLAYLREFKAVSPTYGELSRPLPEAVQTSLGVDRFWSHQAEAIDLLRAGLSTVVATGTSSGKSLCYQAVIAEAACAPLRARTSLLLFPTKALAQDQARSLAKLGLARLAIGTYDGDASPEARIWVRQKATVVLTNPEMVHYGLLPNHARWRSFLSRLQYVVIDELHLLRGVFGSHVAHVLRRLRRLCAVYGSDPTFVFASATIGEPARLAEELCGKDVTAVITDGSPKAPRTFLLWNPHLRKSSEHRISTGGETAAIAAQLIDAGLRTIVFSRSRKGTELSAAEISRRLRGPGRVRPYRGGYLAEERREIEHELFSGQLDGIVTTSALELGIDVAGLDACVVSGFPGTVTSLRQQIGRVGRADARSIAVLVAGEDQLDQWLVRHPAALFERPPEPAVVSVANPAIFLPQLECAATERPLTRDDERFWPADLDEGVRRLAAADQLVVRHRGFGSRTEPIAAWNGTGWPSHRIGLRSSSGGEIVLLAAQDGRRIGTVDEAQAATMVHPGAVYLHQGLTWDVVSLDVVEKVAVLAPSDGLTFTTPRLAVSLRILSSDRSGTIGALPIGLGTIEIHRTVTGFQTFDTRTRTSYGVTPLRLAPSILRTRGVWYCFEQNLIEAAGLQPRALPGSLHALEHAAIGMLPLFLICDRWDVGGVSTALQDELKCASVTIYDGSPGGSGIAELAFERVEEHLAATLEAIEACSCQSGCPSCVQSPKCGNGNEPLDKRGAACLARAGLSAS